MNRRVSTTLLIALTAAPGWAASGTPAPDLTPSDRAMEAYNRGLEYREKALELEGEAAALSGEDRQAKLQKAAKEYKKAVRSQRNAIDLDSDLYQAHSSLGFALRKLGEYEESLTAYDQALALSPGYSEAIEYRAEAYLGLGRLDEVKEAYMQLFRQDRAQANGLMMALQEWTSERAEDPGDLSAEAVEEFSAWVAERAAAASQTAELATGVVAGW